MMVSLIVAMSENRVIGRNNQLPWNLPDDLKYFRRITMGHPVIVGRKTFEAMGKPLPGRSNVVITHQLNYSVEGANVVRSLEEALSLCQQLAGNNEVFIIGGAEIYRQALPHAKRIYLTLIHQSFDGDALFPGFDTSQFTEVFRERHESPIPHSYLVYERK